MIIIIPFVIAVLVAVVVLIKVIDLCYIFQVKEYRMDRFSSTLNEDGLFPTLYCWPRLATTQPPYHMYIYRC